MPVPQDKPISAYNPTPIFTSWIRFGLWGSNFSGAAAEGNNGNVGRVVGLFPTLERPLGDRPRRFAFITKDEEGDFWVDTKLSKEEWAGFEGVKVTYSALEAPRVAEAGTIST